MMENLLENKITIPRGDKFPKSSMLPLSTEDTYKIHEASLHVLGRTGVRFTSQKVLNLFKHHNFEVDGEIVYFNEQQILTAFESITRQFTILARNPDYNIAMKPGISSFGMGRGAVYWVEPDGFFRIGASADLIKVAKLFQCMELLEHYNPLIFPCDIDPANVRLWMCKQMIEYTDKPAIYTDREDIDLVALSYGTSRKEMMDRTDMHISYGRTTAISTSPLTFFNDDCENIIEYSRCGIAFHTASMPIAAVSGPCTVSGTVVIQNCENIAAIVLSQLIRPGCPVFYGAIGGTADMRSLRPRFGSVDAMHIERCGVQMARFYGLLCRGGAGLTDSLGCDFQAGAQAMLNTLSVIYDGPNFIPACGLLGSYIGASLAKVVLDEELITQAIRFLEPVNTDSFSLAVDVIEQMGPGGCFINHDHTLNNFRKVLHTESLFTAQTYEEQQKHEKREVIWAAHEKAEKLIASYELPPIDQGLQEAVDEYLKTHWK